MTEAEFRAQIAALDRIPFREDFETALCDLYSAACEEQRSDMRDLKKAGILEARMPWKNPTDYDRSDLTIEQRCRQHLIMMSIRDGGPDFRDDLCDIAHCYHNLAALGVNADKVLDKLARLSSPLFAKLVLNFRNRKPKDKSPKAFRLKLVQTPAGPKYDVVP